MSDDKLELIRKLLAKAEGAATEHEAEAYNVKAAELMARHGIDEALLSASGKKDDKIGKRKITMDRPYSTEKATLLGWIGLALRCRCVHTTMGKTTLSVTLMGFESDLERVEMLYTSLLVQATGQVVHQRPPQYGWDGPTHQEVAAYRRTWLTGFASAVHSRLVAAEERAIKQEDAEHPSASGTSTELVIVDRKQQVSQAYEEAYPDLGQAKGRKLTGGGYSSGHKAGQRADLGQTRVGTNRGKITR